MKIVAITSFFVLVSVFFVEAQNLKKKTKDSGNLKEIFYIDKKSEMKEGGYNVINTQNKNTLVIGQFTNGIRTGIWSFFDTKSGEKKLEYNFTEKNIAFLNPEIYPDSFLVRTGNDFAFEKVDRPLILIGYDDELQTTLENEINIPVEVFEKQIFGTSMIGYIIDEEGNFKGSQLLMPLHPKVEQEINRIVSSFTGRFLPAIYQGKPVQSMLMVKANLISDKKAAFYHNKLPYLVEIDVICSFETARRVITTRKTTSVVSSGYR